MWFYADNGISRGPHSLEQLAAALKAAPDPSQMLVWREGLAGWQPAAAVPELAAKLTPSPAPTPAPVPPRERVPTFGATVTQELTRAAADEAVFVATQYRSLVLLVGAQLVPGIVIQMLAASGSLVAALVAFVLGLACLGLALAMAVTVYRLMGVLGGAPALWAVGMFMPLLNIVLLLVISAQAQSWCKQRGIQVGFLGPTPESIDWLRHGG